MKISPARKAAFEILNRIENEKAFSSALLPHFQEKLDEKDSALCHKLTLGVLRSKLYLDWVISLFTKKNPEKFDIEVVNALRIGLYQLFFLDKVPAYSAINESVNLVKMAKKRSASGLVNAVLRRASKEKPTFDASTPLEKLSVETSHPQWLLQYWIDQFGLEDTTKIARSNNDVPAKCFRVTRRFEDSPERFKQDFFEFLKTEDAEVEEFDLVAGCFTAKGLSEKIRQFLALGLIYFQDPASQMVADSVILKDDERFIDICASPGSKASRINANTTAERTTQISGDIHRGRVSILRESFNRQGIEDPNIVRYDAETSLPFEYESFGLVLVDAPCSGTGTIRHNPEIRYSLHERDFKELSSKQLSILKNASELIKMRGLLVYSTCSLERIENEGVIDSFLSQHQGFTKVDDIGFLPRFLTPDGFNRTFPHRDNMDGFFVAVLRREA